MDPAASPPPVRRARLVPAVTGVGLLLLWSLTGACQGMTLPGREVAPRAAACADCHRAIARQWRCSPHAQAWTDAAFVEESRHHTKPECLACHAPLPLLEQGPDDPLRLRAQRRHEGVDCSACHQVGCAQAGSNAGLAPHPTIHDGGRLASTEFCGTCHRMEEKEHKTLYAKALGDSAQSCVDCHMPARIDRLTQGSVLSGLHPRRVVRDHSLATWTPGRLSGVIETTRPRVEQDTVVVVLTNRGAGHRIPTGAHGHRELRVRVRLLDAQGNEVARAVDSLLSLNEDGLEPGKARTLTLTLEREENTAQPARVHLHIDHVNAAGRVRGVLLDRAWPMDQD